MKHNVEAFKKYYINATKEEVIEDMFLDNCNLQNEIERLNNIIKEVRNRTIKMIANSGLDFMYRQAYKDILEILKGE